jgi:hypothetical protein
MIQRFFQARRAALSRGWDGGRGTVQVGAPSAAFQARRSKRPWPPSRRETSWSGSTLTTIPIAPRAAAAAGLPRRDRLLTTAYARHDRRQYFTAPHRPPSGTAQHSTPYAGGRAGTLLPQGLWLPSETRVQAGVQQNVYRAKNRQCGNTDWQPSTHAHSRQCPLSTWSKGSAGTRTPDASARAPLHKAGRRLHSSEQTQWGASTEGSRHARTRTRQHVAVGMGLVGPMGRRVWLFAPPPPVVGKTPRCGVVQQKLSLLSLSLKLMGSHARLAVRREQRAGRLPSFAAQRVRSAAATRGCLERRPLDPKRARGRCAAAARGLPDPKARRRRRVKP